MTIVELKFGSMRKNKKGIPVTDLFIQLLCFFMDGTSRHISWFDHLKSDESYAALLATKEECLASSHSVKSFFGRFSFVRDYLFRCLLQRLFIWRLRKTRPNVIELGSIRWYLKMMMHGNARAFSQLTRRSRSSTPCR